MNWINEKQQFEAVVVNALLTGQRKVIYSGVELILTPLKPNTLKKKETTAKKEAEKLYKIYTA